MDNDSVAERRRVAESIAASVKEFFSLNKTFRMQDLTIFVSDSVSGYIAPDSPGRIMRMLKLKGEINYKLIDRSKSLYEVA